MIPGDYTERTRKTRKGKTVKQKIVKSVTGVEYVIGKRIGAGAVARIYNAWRVSDHKECVFKEYIPGSSPETAKAHRGIKSNIRKLMTSPIVMEDGVTRIDSFVGPMDTDSLIELEQSKGFGYIMEKVDTKVFLPVPKLWHEATHPDAEIMCKAIMNIAYLFKRIHLRGWCYKDINEGNIYINNVTGEVRLIDCDNISTQHTKTILGTHGYIAPEVYETGTPDTYTDYFSMAVLFYRMLVGGYPMDGRKTVDYMNAHNLSVEEAAPVIYGSMALFAFDPADRSNSLDGLIDPLSPNMYSIQTDRWNSLPSALQVLFIRTFSDGLKNENRSKRVSDTEWIRGAEQIMKNGIVRCSCGKYTFADPKRTLKCIFCGKAAKPSAPAAPATKTCTAANELTTVTFRAKRDIAPTRFKIEAKRRQVMPGSQIHPVLKDGWMTIKYRRSGNLLAAFNTSDVCWLASYNGSSRACMPGEHIVLRKGMIITVLRRQLQLTVTDIR